jgi:hypothetical protein
MPKIVFITRGHGYGHAARDLLVVEAMRRAAPDVELVLAASGTGAEYYRRRGVEFVDLGIPDERDTGEEAGRTVFEFLTSQGPVDLVVVDEVMWALPICARVLKVPCVLLTDWFYSEIGRPLLDATMNQAVEIFVTDFPEAHPEPTGVTVPVTYTGPLVKPMDLTREQARRELGVTGWTGVLTLGGMPDRPQANAIRDLVVDAWQDGELIVLADGESTGRVRFVGVTDVPERYFRAADVVLAEAMGFTVCELTRHGVPTVAVRYGPLSSGVHGRLNLLEKAGLVTLMDADDSPEHLWRTVRSLPPSPADTGLLWGNADEVAARCLSHLPVG